MLLAIILPPISINTYAMPNQKSNAFRYFCDLLLFYFIILFYNCECLRKIHIFIDTILTSFCELIYMHLHTSFDKIVSYCYLWIYGSFVGVG